MQTTVETTFAVVDDITPNRATVIAVGSDEDELTGKFVDRSDVAIIEVPARVDIGERIWIRHKGGSVEFAARGA